MSNCFGAPPKDLVLNNLVVCDNATMNKVKINKLDFNTFGSTVIPLDPSFAFELTQNNSTITGNIVQISFSGNVTGDIANFRIPIGNIPLEVAPLNDTFGITCQVPAGILVFKLNPSGLIETCVSGFGFNIGTYPVSINILYII